LGIAVFWLFPLYEWISPGHFGLALSNSIRGACGPSTVSQRIIARPFYFPQNSLFSQEIYIAQCQAILYITSVEGLQANPTISPAGNCRSRVTQSGYHAIFVLWPGVSCHFGYTPIRSASLRQSRRKGTLGLKYSSQDPFRNVERRFSMSASLPID